MNDRQWRERLLTSYLLPTHSLLHSHHLSLLQSASPPSPPNRAPSHPFSPLPHLHVTHRPASTCRRTTCCSCSPQPSPAASSFPLSTCAHCILTFTNKGVTLSNLCVFCSSLPYFFPTPHVAHLKLPHIMVSWCTAAISNNVPTRLCFPTSGTVQPALTPPLCPFCTAAVSCPSGCQREPV